MSKKVYFCKAIVHWKSGRTETFADKLNISGKPPKPFMDKVAKYREIPTVVKIQVERF